MYFLIFWDDKKQTSVVGKSLIVREKNEIAEVQWGEDTCFGRILKKSSELINV